MTIENANKIVLIVPNSFRFNKKIMSITTGIWSVAEQCFRSSFNDNQPLSLATSNRIYQTDDSLERIKRYIDSTRQNLCKEINKQPCCCKWKCSGSIWRRQCRWDNVWSIGLSEKLKRLEQNIALVIKFNGANQQVFTNRWINGN